MPLSVALRRMIAAVILAGGGAGAFGAAAQSVDGVANDLGAPVETYTAYIGQSDLRNSRGQRLRDVAAILRQDRANFHRFGVAHKGDEPDTRFLDLAARSIMERLLERGGVTPEVAERILEGDVLVRVEVYADAEGALDAVAVRIADGQASDVNDGGVNDAGATQ